MENLHPLLTDIRVRLEDVANAVESIKTGAKTYLTAPEAAAYLGISIKTLYKHTHKNVIPFYKPNGKLISFLKSDLDNWINKTRVPSNDELKESVNLKINHHGK